MRYDDPDQWLAFLLAQSNPDTVPDGLVQATQFIYVRREDRRIVGMINLRHYFNGYLEKYGGHIGYSVRPSERRRGIASAMLKACLPHCLKAGLHKVLITCKEGNAGSRKTIMKNGGVYESTVFEPDEKINLERYWISIK